VNYSPKFGNKSRIHKQSGLVPPPIAIFLNWLACIILVSFRNAALQFS